MVSRGLRPAAPCACVSSRWAAAEGSVRGHSDVRAPLRSLHSRAMLLGAHESAAGGCHRVFERCARDGAEAVQLWTRSSRKWQAPELDAQEVLAFRRAHAAYGAAKIPAAAHASYLINLATEKPEVRARRTDTQLGAPSMEVPILYAITHPEWWNLVEDRFQGIAAAFGVSVETHA